MGHWGWRPSHAGSDISWVMLSSPGIFRPLIIDSLSTIPSGLNIICETAKDQVGLLMRPLTAKPPATRSKLASTPLLSRCSGAVSAEIAPKSREIENSGR